ncbi:MAG TPA: hypothetical protein VLL52_07730 [Anaerolineae bacterium]|nr:hypothetical protein [Anaerolineae bacterium]
MTVIVLPAYRSVRLPAASLPLALGERLWREQGQGVGVTFPSPVTNDEWVLYNQGWLGRIVMAEGYVFDLQARLPLQNVWRMWAYAYGLERWPVVAGVYETGSVVDFLEGVGLLLAEGVLRLVRRGLWRQYGTVESRGAIRGRLVTADFGRGGLPLAIRTRHQVSGVDHEDNQILLYTLGQLLAAGWVDEARGVVGKAYHALRGEVGWRAFTAADCEGRVYSRLAADYEWLHGVCAFILEQLGPAATGDGRLMRSFVIKLPYLFEKFVAGWLGQNLAEGWQLQVQRSVPVRGVGGEVMRYQIDMVLAGPGGEVVVLDTKYKDGGRPGAADLNQMVAYAQLQGGKRAWLVYPGDGEERPFLAHFGAVEVGAAYFDLSGDLEVGGLRFWEQVVGGG